MGLSLFRRGVITAVVIALGLTGLAAPGEAASYRAASTDQFSDAVGDTIGFATTPVVEPRADITGARAIVHGDNRLELTVTVAQPTDPATDPGWAEGATSLQWLINPRGNPSLVVVLRNNPQLTAAVTYISGETAVGCVPVADYSPARYSVTLAPSCLQSSSEFRWDVTMIYDADPSANVPGAADQAPGGDLGAMADGPVTLNDPTGDVTVTASATDPRADLTTTSARYDGDGITLTASVVDPTDPRADPGWARGSAIVSWALDTGGDIDPDFYVNLSRPDLVAHVFTDAAAEMCTPAATYSPAGYTVTIDAACVGSPVTFRWAAAMLYSDDHAAALDTAPDSDQLAGPVSAPPRTTGTTTQPQLRPSASQSGYWMITDTGDVFGFGDARHYGNEAGPARRADIEATRTGAGYWILASDGAVSAKGDAPPLGDATGRLQPGEGAAALSATPSGGGYWIFTDRGRVLPFGDAPFLGDLTDIRLNGPVLDSVATPTGRGYWMVASDGGIFTFGDATFSGSTGNIKLNQPVMSMAADPDGDGYWLVASDGGIFAFDAPFYGSMGATKLNKPISGMVPGQAGYLMVGEDGGIFAFGNVAFHGSLGATPPANPVVAVALTPAAR